MSRLIKKRVHIKRILIVIMIIVNNLEQHFIMSLIIFQNEELPRLAWFSTIQLSSQEPHQNQIIITTDEECQYTEKASKNSESEQQKKHHIQWFAREPSKKSHIYNETITKAELNKPIKLEFSK